jgi:hypothetical protein
MTVEEMALPLRRGGDFLQSSSGNALPGAVFDIAHRDYPSEPRRSVRGNGRVKVRSLVTPPLPPIAREMRCSLPSHTENGVPSGAIPSFASDGNISRLEWCQRPSGSHSLVWTVLSGSHERGCWAVADGPEAAVALGRNASPAAAFYASTIDAIKHFASES